VKRRRAGGEESIAQFVVRRLNQEFLDHAVDALAAGVYAGDPYKLSVQHAFPRLAELEARYGSLIRGQIFGARARRQRGEIAKDRAPKFSFDEGLQVLPDTLAALLGDSVKLNTSVTRLTQRENGWQVSTAIGEAGHQAVIYCGTAYRLAELEIRRTGVAAVPNYFKAEGDRHDARPTTFSEIRYPPVASVVLGFRRQDVEHPCEGFGMLIPKVEGFKILGAIFSSSLFPNRAPAGHLTLSSYVGGERQPELASLAPEALVETTLADLRTILGVRGWPVFTQTAVYPRAIPQYNLGYGRYRQLMSDVESTALGLFLAGHYRDGVSLGDSMVSGCNVAERVEKFLPTR
jgi:oxygen-dependent protoporphyrinogen oxidase